MLFENETTFENNTTEPHSLSENTPSIHSTQHTYRMVKEEEKLIELCNKICSQKSVCFDTETTGVNPLLSELVGLSFAYKEGEAYYVPIDDDREKAQQKVDIFRPFFEDEKIEKVGQNIKYDILELRNYDIQVKGKLFDTMIAHYLINPEIPHGMDYMAKMYLNYTTIHIDELIGPKGKNQKICVI